MTPRLTICDRCSTLLEVGDWPFCPHGPGRVTVISDSIPGGQLIENLGPEPVRVYSETERQRIMKERGLVDAVRHRDGSKLTSNWAGGATAKMLEDAIELVSRPARRTRADELDADVPVTITVTERGSFSVPPDGEPHAD